MSSKGRTTLTSLLHEGHFNNIAQKVYEATVKPSKKARNKGKGVSGKPKKAVSADSSSMVLKPIPVLPYENNSLLRKSCVEMNVPLEQSSNETSRFSLLSNEDLKLIYKMYMTMSSHGESVGISAPQIQSLKRCFIGVDHVTYRTEEKFMTQDEKDAFEQFRPYANIPSNIEKEPIKLKTVDHIEFEAYINPQVLEYSYQDERDLEGCLSVHEYMCIVRRPKEIRVKYVNALGETVVKDLFGLAARVFLHELDHMNGILMLDRLEGDNDLIPERDAYKFLNENMELADVFKKGLDQDEYFHHKQ